MHKFNNILDLDKSEISKLKKSPSIDNLSISPREKKRIIKEMSNKNSIFTLIQKSILKLHLGIIDLENYSIFSISNILGLPVFKVRYYLNSACYSIRYSYKIYKHNSMQNFYNYDLNYDLLNITEGISDLQYNVLILFFKYNVNPIDIEFYYLIPNINVMLLHLLNKYPNIFIKKGDKKMIELQADFKRTRSNRFILKDINIEDFLKYFNSLDNTTSEMENTLKKILTGKLLKNELETLPEYTTVCQYIEKYITLTKHKDSFLIDSNSSKSTSKTTLFDDDTDEVKNNSNEVESSKTCNNIKVLKNQSSSTLITDKLFYILKKDIKIKKKDRKKLYKLWNKRLDNSENFNSILLILDSVISKK